MSTKTGLFFDLVESDSVSVSSPSTHTMGQNVNICLASSRYLYFDQTFDIFPACKKTVLKLKAFRHKRSFADDK